MYNTHDIITVIVLLDKFDYLSNPAYLGYSFLINLSYAMHDIFSQLYSQSFLILGIALILSFIISVKNKINKIKINNIEKIHSVLLSFLLLISVFTGVASNYVTPFSFAEYSNSTSSDVSLDPTTDTSENAIISESLIWDIGTSETVSENIELVQTANQTSAKLDGEGYLTENIETSNRLSSFTISVWIKPDYSSGSSEFTVLSKQNAFALSSQEYVPNWVKTGAGWWSDGVISDTDFVSGIQYLIDEDIIHISTSDSAQSSSSEIPPWIRNNAKWWSEDMISDSDFISGMQYLIKVGFLKV